MGNPGREFTPNSECPSFLSLYKYLRRAYPAPSYVTEDKSKLLPQGARASPSGGSYILPPSHCLWTAHWQTGCSHLGQAPGAQQGPQSRPSCLCPPAPRPSLLGISWSCLSSEHRSFPEMTPELYLLLVYSSQAGPRSVKAETGLCSPQLHFPHVNSTYSLCTP